MPVGKIRVAVKEEPDAVRALHVTLEPNHYGLLIKLKSSANGLRNCTVVGRTLDCIANDYNADLIEQLAKEFDYEVEFANDLAKMLYQRCSIQGLMRKRAAEMRATWQTGAIDDKMAAVESPEGQFALAPYQRAACAISRLSRDYALFMEQGTGKTPIVVSRVNTDAKALTENRMYRALILCPKQLRTNWANEFKNFSTVPGKVTVFRDSLVKRLRALVQALTPENDEKFTVVIASFGLMVESWDEVLKHVPWDLAVIDESQNIKAHGAKRTKMCMRVRERAAARMILSGTPIVNSVMDLYSQLEFLGEGMSNYRSMHAFRARFSQVERRGNTTVNVPMLDNIPEIKQRLAEVSFQVRKEDVLKDLPPKQYDIIEADMTERQWTDYEALATRLALEIEAELDATDENKREMVVNNAFVKLMKLAQITSGFLILNEERDEDGTIVHERETIFYPDNPKLKELMEEVRALPQDEKMIVWSCWVPAIQQIHGAMAAEGIDHVLFYGQTSEKDREAAVWRFNHDPACRYLVGNQAAGGAGLNLLGYDYDVSPPTQVTDCTTQIYYAMSHKPAERWQSEDRPHRRGTRRPVKTRDLVVPCSIDEEIRVKVTQKKKSALEIQDLREILSNIIERMRDR